MVRGEAVILLRRPGIIDYAWSLDEVPDRQGPWQVLGTSNAAAEI